LSRSTLIAAAGIVIIALAIGMSIWLRHDGQRSAPATNSEKNAAQSNQPSFDVVRINPQGNTVIAGRGMPRAEIVILDGGKEIGRVIADNRGEWVFVPDQPLPPGSRELTLQATNPDGTKSQTDAPVVLVVPDRKDGVGQALAVKVKKDGSIEVLQGAEAGEGAGEVAIVGVRYDSHDRLAVAGKAPAKARIFLYVDDKPLVHVRADSDGKWHASPKINLKAGEHHIRADEVDAAGKVLHRVEITFTPGGTLPTDGKITVEPGNSLWRLARQIYGTGYEYMTIYQANKGQIRDPNLIYPGQVIEIPAAK
jgi:nucleoid-associated protein YgaU